ncbi:bacteriocin immunity protein [Paenibacillus sp. MAH-36]|uniref:Bacteriocin immunity protein n=1 Tax=Paenibacillus violae TaxID=3077234 RepID=A0ABU3RIV9_9BACL|nr:bacteriocin immunity protein [Paenibacillus sp. PFR10]MDU0203964.1 bacteriocin immunity protein [Paenibacillus sp. PFR10]
MKALSKDQLIELVRKIMRVEGSEEEIDNMIEFLKFSVPHPEVSDLIYWNENELTAEEVVEQALSYKPI